MKLLSRASSRASSLASSLALLSKLASTTSTGYSSTCTTDGFVEITIPYTNAITSELLSAVAPSCNARGPSSDHHTYTFDEANNKAILKLNIESCGLGEIYGESRLRSDGEYFMAAANVTLGVHDVENDRDLIFYNAFLGAECGQKLDYTVTFDYSQKIQKHEETECHEFTPEGQCIIAAYDTYSFIFREYSSGDFDELVEDGAVHMANNMIYLQIEALDLPESKKFAVKKCDFLDTVTDADGVVTTERYNMFTAAEGTCANRYIELAFGYDFSGSQTSDQMAAQITHRLFLLAQGDQDSYDLECELKVCNKDDTDSDCNSWSVCLEGEDNHENYVCEAACGSDEECSTDSDGNGVCSATPTGPVMPQEVIDALNYYTIDHDRQVSVTLVWRSHCDLNAHIYTPDGMALAPYQLAGINSFGISDAYAYDDYGDYVEIDGETALYGGGHDFGIDYLGLDAAVSGEYIVKLNSYCGSDTIAAQLYIEVNGVLSLQEIIVLRDPIEQYAFTVGPDLRSGSSIRVQPFVGAEIDETLIDRQARRQQRRQQNNQ